jgi:hypothetical protein
MEAWLAAVEGRQTRGEKQAAENLSTMDTVLNQRLGLLYANVTSAVEAVQGMQKSRTIFLAWDCR